MKLVLKAGKASCVSVDAHDASGAVVDGWEVDPRKGRLNKVLEWAKGWLTEAEFRKACFAVLGGEARVELSPPAVMLTLPPVRVRMLNQSANTARVETVESALQTAEPGEVIEWESRAELCCLDVDYHDRDLPQRPAESWLLSAAARLKPAPFAYWLSQNRGLHALYGSLPPLTAEQWAACAGLSWLNIDSSATFDLCKSSKAPPGPVTHGAQTIDTSALGALFRGDVDADKVDTWLAENSYERNVAYPHDRCPVSPGVASHGTPIFVGTDGVKCHKCESLGIAFGSRTPGYFPYRALVGGPPGPLRRMVDRLTHWEHAKLIIADALKLPGEKARLAYTAACILAHGADDPRVSRVATAGDNVIRLGNRWATRNALESWDKNSQPMLAALPACQGKDGKPIQERISRFSQNHDLTEYGYPPVVPIRGLKIFGEYLPYPDGAKAGVVVPSQELAGAECEKYRPRYVPPAQRVPLDECWSLLDPLFPKLDRNYLQLLIAARGVSEGQYGLAPLLLVCGPSGAGKSNTVHIAATICGDHCTEVSWTNNLERFRQGIAEGADKGTFVAVNELLKDAAKFKRNEREALDVFLNVTPDSVSHRMYVGPVALGRVPVTVVTDTAVPQLLRDDVQLARRFVYIRLRNRVEWQITMGAAGMHDFQALRRQSPAHTAACDGIVSHVIDTWFRGRTRTLTEIAGELGFSTLENSPDFENPEVSLRRFFDLVCAAPALAPPVSRRWSGAGWKQITRDGESDLSEAWSQLCNDDDWTRSRQCECQDWRRVLGCDTEVTFEVRHRGALVVRFKGPGRQSPLVNGELIEGYNERRDGAQADPESGT